MGLNIHLGGVAADMGGALGAGVSRGVDEALEENRRKQQEKERQDYENAVRARGFELDQQVREEKQTYDAGLLAEKRTYDADVLAEKRGFDAKQADAAQEAENLQAGRTAVERIGALFQGNLARDGEPMSESQFAHEKLKRETEEKLTTPGLTVRDVSDILFTLDQQLGSLAEQEDNQEMEGAFAAISTPDENGVTVASESDLLNLQNLMDSGDVQGFRQEVGAVTERHLNQVARDGLFNSVAEVVSASVHRWKEQPMPSHVMDGTEEAEYMSWRQAQEGQIARAIKTQTIMRQALGGNYNPFEGEAAINEILYAVDPVTKRKVLAQEKAEEEERAAAEAAVTGMWKIAETAESAEDAEARIGVVKDATLNELSPSGLPSGKPFIKPKPTNPAKVMPWYTGEVERLMDDGRAEDADFLLNELERKIEEMDAQTPAPQ